MRATRREGEQKRHQREWAHGQTSTQRYVHQKYKLKYYWVEGSVGAPRARPARLNACSRASARCVQDARRHSAASRLHRGTVCVVRKKDSKLEMC